MTYKQLFDEIGDYHEYIIRIRCKYAHEDYWDEFNTFLEWDPDYGHVWHDDWNEGQEEFDIVGYIDVDDIKESWFRR